MQIRNSFLVLTLAIGVFLTACDSDDQTSSPQSNLSQSVEQPVAKSQDCEESSNLSLQNSSIELDEQRRKVTELQNELDAQRKRADNAEQQVKELRQELENAKKMVNDGAKEVEKARMDVVTARAHMENVQKQVGRTEGENWWLKVALSTIGAFVVVFFVWMFWPRKVTSSTASERLVARPRCPRCGWEHDPADTICKNPNCKTQF